MTVYIHLDERYDWQIEDEFNAQYMVAVEVDGETAARWKEVTEAYQRICDEMAKAAEASDR